MQGKTLLLIFTSSIIVELLLTVYLEVILCFLCMHCTRPFPDRLSLRRLSNFFLLNRLFAKLCLHYTWRVTTSLHRTHLWNMYALTHYLLISSIRWWWLFHQIYWSFYLWDALGRGDIDRFYMNCTKSPHRRNRLNSFSPANRSIDVSLRPLHDALRKLYFF